MANNGNNGNGAGAPVDDDRSLIADLDAAMARGCDFLAKNLPQHAGTWLAGPQPVKILQRTFLD